MELSCLLSIQALSCRENLSCFGVLSHVINPLLTILVRSRWLDVGLILFCVFMDLDFVSVHKLAKKRLGQYPAILTSCLVNNPHIHIANVFATPSLFSPLLRGLLVKMLIRFKILIISITQLVD